jgi:predicted Ser/Thr protein kinase
MVGQTVGKYRIVARLGRGGMGTVYKAVDETLDREVAIKCLNPDLSDPETLKRFRAEAVALAKLNHQNIATLFELTEHDGDLLMVMEFVRGETFENLTQRYGPLPMERSRDLCSQVLDALGHAHRAGIVHRDLKPANLMLTESGVVKVMDFGLARMAGTEHLTNDGFMVGTPAYMAPEQVLAEEIDGRADLYAVGVVLFRLLTAQLPFKADSGISMAHKQVHDAPTPVRRLRTELPAACEDIIARSLAKSPADRFPTADEFRAALASLGGTGIGAGSSASIAVPQSAPAAVPDHPTLVMPSRLPKKFPVAALAGALALAGIPTTAVVLWRSWPAGTQAAPPSGSPPAPVVPSPGSTPVMAPVTDAPSASLSPVRKAGSSTAPRTVTAARPTPDATGPPSPMPRERLFPPITFAQIKLLVLDEEKPRDRDVLVRLGVDTLELLDGGKPFQTLRYADVVGVYQSHAREPRWTKPDGTSVALAKMGGSRLSFFRSAPDWITVQTKSSFVPLHVPESELARLVAELEMRIGTKVVQTR